MNRSLTEFSSSQTDGLRSKGSSYPESESAYFRRRYGSDNYRQLHDGNQKEAIYHYAKPERLSEITKTLNQLEHLTCTNAPEMVGPGRSAYSLELLRQNLAQYQQAKCRSLRWNQHYQLALKSVAHDVLSLANGRLLKPMSIEEVSTSVAVTKNLDKNAGYMAFETDRRSKGENLSEAVEWVHLNQACIAERGHYGLPLVIAHRSSNSKPVNDKEWKWRCRIILMQDVRALLMDGRFAIPFTELFQRCPWGEGSMSTDDVRAWISLRRKRNPYFYSTDYSRFDTSQPAWLLEDVFDIVVRPLFGQLSLFDEAMFKAMRDSYINKEIHTFDGTMYVKGCQLSGALTTYAYNTIINEIIDRTSLLMQGCDPTCFKSLKCGDDNLTFYAWNQPWDAKKHCELIRRYFGIETTLGDDDYGSTSEKDPVFLSRRWTEGGLERPLNEVLFNLVYPERYRDYVKIAGCRRKVEAVALILYCACLEQDLTMRRYFDVEQIRKDAGITKWGFKGLESAYQDLAELGGGFSTDWIRWHLSLAT